MSGSAYLGHATRLRLLELGGRSPSYQDSVYDEAENLRKRLLSGPTVDIFVGAERKQWTLHRKLLCFHSTYFEAEFEGHEVPKDIEKNNQLELPDDDPVGFELLVKWLYQGQLEDTSTFSDEARYDYAVACHKLYLLCDKFDMIRLKNIAMDRYRESLHECQLVPDANEIDDIYRASPVNSAFRRLMINIAARQIMDPEVDRDAEAYRKCLDGNPDFAIEMIMAVRQMSGGILFDDPTGGDFCAYHDHSGVLGCRIEGKGKGRARAQQTRPGAEEGTTRRRVEVLPVVELSAEKRTPRKLKSPHKTARNGPSTPGVNQNPARHKTRSAPRKLERREQPLSDPSKAAKNPSNESEPGSQTSPFDDSSQAGSKVTNGLRVPSLSEEDIIANPTETSPTVSRSGGKRQINAKPVLPVMSELETLLPPIGGRSDSRSSLNALSTPASIRSEKLTPAPSRKRKMDERGPGRGNIQSSEHASASVEQNGRACIGLESSRAGSTIAEPKKPNGVSSIAQKFNGEIGAEAMSEGKRAPSKSRTSSQPTRTR